MKGCVFGGILVVLGAYIGLSMFMGPVQAFWTLVGSVLVIWGFMLINNHM